MFPGTLASDPPLPEELLLKICGFIDDRRTLLDVLTVSHLFQRLGELILYDTVTIRSRERTMSRMSQFRDTVTSRKDLGHRVKTLALNMQLGSRRDIFDSIPRRLASDILCELPKLRRLIIHGPFVVRIDLPNSNPPFSLTHLRWNNALNGDEKLFSAFLELQPSLEFLDIKGTGIMALSLSEKAVPRLRVLLATWNAATDILPTRHIAHLDVVVEGEERVHLDAKLLASFEHVQSLRCVAGLADYAAYLTGKFPNLKCFSLSCMSSFHHDPLTQGGPGGLTDLLLSLSSKTINYISITMDSVLESPHPAIENVRAIFAAFPSLLTFDFHNHPDSYRYTPQSSTPLRRSYQQEVDAFGWDLWWQNRGLEDDDDHDVKE